MCSSLRRILLCSIMLNSTFRDQNMIMRLKKPVTNQLSMYIFNVTLELISWFGITSLSIQVLCIVYFGLPRWHGGKELICQYRRHKRPRFSTWVREIPWRREWQPPAVFLPGESHGQRSLVGYSPWVTKSQTRLKGISTNNLFCISLHGFF